MLITGVSGQSGSYLAELLLCEGCDVYGLVRRSSAPNLWRIQHLLDNKHFHIVHGDVTDAGFMTKLIHDHEFDEVYNLAAQSFVGTSYAEPTHTTQVCLNGCLNILEAIRTAKYIRPRFYQASTSEMFGTSYSMENEYDMYTVVEQYDSRQLTPPQVVAGCYLSDTAEERNVKLLESQEEFKKKTWLAKYYEKRMQVWQDENTPFRPTSPYAVAKLAAHNLVGIYRQAYGIHACSGILFNHESPRRGEEFVTRKITRYVGRLVEFGLTKIGSLKLGNLDACRDWGHARDYVHGQVKMLRHDTPDDYVLATGKTQSIRQLLDEAFGYVGRDWSKCVEVSQSEMRPSEVPYLRGDASKAKNVIGWEPEHSFQSLIREMVESDIQLARKESHAI